MSLRLDRTMLVHVPRTGGTWIREVVDRLGLLRQHFRGDVDSHFSLDQLRPYWGHLTPFIVVRHPWTWLESRWSHAVKIRAYQNMRHFGVHRRFDEACLDTFEQTVSSILNRFRPGIVGTTYWTMRGGVSEPTSSVSVVRFENLIGDLREFLVHNEQMPGLSHQQLGARYDEVVAAIPPNNSTSAEAREAGLLRCSDELRLRFLKSEEAYLSEFYPDEVT